VKILNGESEDDDDIGESTFLLTIYTYRTQGRWWYIGVWGYYMEDVNVVSLYLLEIASYPAHTHKLTQLADFLFAGESYRLAACGLYVCVCVWSSGNKDKVWYISTRIGIYIGYMVKGVKKEVTSSGGLLWGLAVVVALSIELKSTILVVAGVVVSFSSRSDSEDGKKRSDSVVTKALSDLFIISLLTIIHIQQLLRQNNHNDQHYFDTQGVVVPCSTRE